MFKLDEISETSLDEMDSLIDLILLLAFLKSEIAKEILSELFVIKLEISSEVCLYVRNTEFSLPESKKSTSKHDNRKSLLKDLEEPVKWKPMVLIGAGSGLAPFRISRRNSEEKAAHQE